MRPDNKIESMLQELDDLCPNGYAIALHIKFVTPTYLFQTYDPEWVEHYSKKGWMLKDPTVHWGFSNSGNTLWETLAPDDSQGVFTKAAEYGLKYGFVFALETNKSRSICSFARADRNYSDSEIKKINSIVQILHDKTFDPTELSDTEHKILTQLSVAQTHDQPDNK